MKKVITILLIATAFLIMIVVLRNIFAPKIKIDVINSRFNSDRAEINGDIYYRAYDGVYKAAENQKNECLIPFDELYTATIFTKGKNCIYTAVKIDNSISITKYDPDGNITGEPFILDKPDGNVIAIDNNCVYGRYGDENDVNFAVFDMNGKTINSDLPEYEYSDDKFSLLGDEENTYYTSTNYQVDYIGRSKNYAAYIGREFSADSNILTIIDLESNDTKQIDFNEMFKGYYAFGNIKDDALCLVMTDSSDRLSFGGGHSKEWDIYSLDLHKYDIYVLTDLKSGKITNQHKTRKYERIIYADAEKAITYYGGKYITYSTDNWKEIESQKADEIKENGSYFFDTCGDHVFVFDDDTDEVINKLSIE